MKRRSFFKNVMALVATVALAPEIAFRSKLAIPKYEPPQKLVEFWYETHCAGRYYSDEYIAEMNKWTLPMVSMKA